MVELDKRLAKELPECHLILQVHDELILDCPSGAAERAKALACEVMEKALPLEGGVPVAVEAQIGANWSECK